MQKKIWYMKPIIFVLIFLWGIYSLNQILINKEERENISTFYEEPENSIDVIFAGTSHPLNGFYPMEMWNSHGIASYNISQSGQMLPVTYYGIQEALRFQTPKVIVLDLYYIIKERKYGNVGMTHNSIDNYKWSSVKLRCILDAVDPKEQKNFLFPFRLYHSRWKELEKKDFFLRSNVKRGANINFGIEENEIPKLLYTDAKSEIPEVSLEYLTKIITLCKEKEVPLLFTILPYHVGEDNDRKEAQEQLAIYNTVLELAEEYEIDCVNYFEILDKIDFDWATDLYDKTHLNYFGGKKVSLYMAEYLQKNYNIPNHKEDLEYQRWHEDYEIYKKELSEEKF